MDKKKEGLSIVMPCRNEEAALPTCIISAKRLLAELHVPGEIIVVDNGSTDDSALVASSFGARVIPEKRPGYGRALRTGMKAARYPVIAMGDADTTYDFHELIPMYHLIKRGRCDIVIGSRFAGGIERGAMTISHKIGVRFLSGIGRLRYHVKVRDFHCGLRMIRRDAARKLSLHTTGMEFATEMIAEAKRADLRFGQTPVHLAVCHCDRRSKLHTIRDGIRHLHYILSRGNL